MLLRTSISNTKKFFSKTLDKFKSFLSGGYQRLPKTPPFNPISSSNGGDMNFTQSYRELDKFYIDFTDRWDSDKDKAKKRSNKKKLSSPISNHRTEVCDGSFMKLGNANPNKNYQEERREEQKKKNRNIVYERKIKEDYLPCSKGDVKERRSHLVAEKIRELEMMDRSNVEHVLDIEEVLHFYSRLTCPAYLDIVDKFFMDMYNELSSLQGSSCNNNSRPAIPSVK